MIDFGVAYDKLASLESSQEIADFFVSQNVKALPRWANQCAISQWMLNTTGKATSTTVVDICDVKDFVKYPTTDAMKNFIADYDLDRYPELVDTNHVDYEASCPCCGDN